MLIELPIIQDGEIFLKKSSRLKKPKKPKDRNILTFKIRHNFDFSQELEKARLVAEFGIKNRTLSSKDVKHFGLKSAISNQVLKKYAKNKKCKRISNIKMGVPAQGIKYDGITISIPCLKINFIPNFHNFNKEVLEVRHIEIGKEYFYIQCRIANEEEFQTDNFIGVDLNSTGHICVAANPLTGKILKLGKKAPHVRKKYYSIRTKLQKQKRYRRIKQLKNKESRIVRDINHKISKKIVEFAKHNNCGIRLEDLTGIRKNTRKTRSSKKSKSKTNNKKQTKKNKTKSLNHNLNTWAFYQLKTMIEYKAYFAGVKVQKIAPHYTSQKCSKSGHLGERSGKIFKSPIYGVENADVNAAFNIALTLPQLAEERDFVKGQFDLSSGSTSLKEEEPKTLKLETQ